MGQHIDLSTVVISPIADRHLPEVLAINNAAFSERYSKWKFCSLINSGELNVLVAECCGNALGFASYSQAPRAQSIDLERLAVSAKFRRQGIGSLLLETLKKRLWSEHLWQLFARVHETDVGAQLFLKANCFRARQVITDLEMGWRAILFDFVRGDPGGFRPRHRFAEYFRDRWGVACR